MYMYNRKPQLYMAGAIPLFFLKSLGNKMNNHLIPYFVHVYYVEVFCFKMIFRKHICSISFEFSMVITSLEMKYHIFLCYDL